MLLECPLHILESLITSFKPESTRRHPEAGHILILSRLLELIENLVSLILSSAHSVYKPQLRLQPQVPLEKSTRFLCFRDRILEIRIHQLNHRENRVHLIRVRIQPDQSSELLHRLIGFSQSEQSEPEIPSNHR